MITTAVEHPHYHLESDLPDTLDPMLLEDTARLVALAAIRAANQ